MRNEISREKAENWGEIDLYRFFATLLGFPTPDRYAALARFNSREVSAGLWHWLKCAGKPPRSSMYRSYEQYEAGYIALFDVGAPAPPVPLIESAYHETIPAQQTVLENVCFFDAVGLKSDPLLTSPDHLLAQLEFGASVRYLQENCKEESARESLRSMERDFLERHLLSWLPSAAIKLESVRAPVFTGLFALLLKFLHNRHDELRRNPE